MITFVKYISINLIYYNMKYPGILNKTFTGVIQCKPHSCRTFLKMYNVYIRYMSLCKEYEYKYPDIYPYIKKDFFYDKVYGDGIFTKNYMINIMIGFSKTKQEEIEFLSEKANKIIELTMSED